MGKLITFWSPYRGKAKVTSSMCAVAGMFGILYPEYEIALSHTSHGSVCLEEKLDSGIKAEDKRSLYERMGITALMLNGMQAALTSEKIRRCALPLFVKSLYLYPGAGAEHTKEVVFSILTECIKQEFTAVFLDLETGWNDVSLRYMKASDFVVIVLPQEPDCTEIIWSEKMEFLEQIPKACLIGGYLENSRYSLNHFIRKSDGRSKGKLAGAVPMNAAFFDAMIQGKTLEFLLRNQLVRKKEENYEFIVQTKKAAEYIKGILIAS